MPWECDIIIKEKNKGEKGYAKRAAENLGRTEEAVMKYFSDHINKGNRQKQEKYSEEEDAIIIEEYKRDKHQYTLRAAERLGRSIHSVSKRKKRLIHKCNLKNKKDEED